MSFTVYKSSAGSGKTYNLVREYLKIVLSHPASFRKILAITFTNKAAEEMKNRIIETLLQLINFESLQPKEKEKTHALIISFQEVSADENVIRKNAQKTLELILHNYSDFAVSTIDSFVHGIVRTFAKDLYIPVNFDVELETDTLLSQAVDVLIGKVGSDSDITNLLVRFIETQVDDQRSLNIEQEIKKICKYLFKEEGMMNIEKLRLLTVKDFFEIQKKLHSLKGKLEEKLMSIAKKGYELIEANNISPKAFYYKEKGIYTYFKNIAAFKIEGISNKNIAKGVENDKWTSDLCTPEEARIILSIKDELALCYKDIQDFALDELQIVNLYALMSRNIFTIAVLGEIGSIIEDIKRENNILHISEFNKKIAAVVLNEPIPFIYERTGERFGNLMIDEFQDTSVLQWLNLLPLIENALSEGGFTMVVGDAKQAIYRWRDGDAEQFIKLPAIVSTHESSGMRNKEDILKRNFINVDLKQNFRSLKQIIEFNNDFFETVSKQLPDKYTEIYKNVVQEYDANKQGGYVQIDFVQKSDDFTIEDNNLDQVINIIDDLINNKGYAPSDIAILCRSNKNANILARFLIEHNIEVVSSESLLLYKSPLIIFVITLFEFIYSKDNIVASVNIINYLVKNKLIETDNFTELLHKVTLDNNFIINLLTRHFPDFDYEKLKNMQLYDLSEEIIRIFKLNDKPSAYLQFFLDVVFSYTLTKKNNISDFLTWWEGNEEKFSVIVPQGINAVKVMTIHKSKGLQFPVVIYPFANEKKKLNKNNFWIDVADSNFPNLNTFLIPANKKVLNTSYSYLYEEEDNKSQLDLMNILYVVLTRPIEKLFIISEVPGLKNETMSVNNLLKSYLLSKNLWLDGNLHYEFGNNAMKTHIDIQKRETQFTLEKFISTRWQNKLIMKYKAKDIWNLEANEASLRWGNIIHNIMGGVISHADVEKNLEKFCLDGSIEAEEKEIILNKINAIISHPLLKGFYEPNNNVINEKDILDAEGQIYRPDRIVALTDKTAVIDYKTGVQEEKHKTQIDKYAGLLLDMGFCNIEKYLVYIDKDVVVSW